MRAFALEQLDAHGERAAALRRHGPLDRRRSPACPSTTRAARAVERNAIRLEREADNWREAVLHATRDAARASSPPGCVVRRSAFFLLGRHDLADLVRPLLELCDGRPPARKPCCCALIVSASGGDRPRAAAGAGPTRSQAIDDRKPTGLGGLMRWLAMVWQGDFDGVDRGLRRGLARRAAAARRRAICSSGIAILDHFSLTEATDDRYGLVAPRARGRRALRGWRCTGSPACSGWRGALVHSEPDRVVALVQPGAGRHRRPARR